ncbi:sulfite exporter TauE/SafE family protein [Achromobacter xylosoxidans]|uniref:sulfite exporter TauE/SafE family protein n=1 Tax=Alcaligenes xylosoxydans xylosoxydans TaxID=85698 RepID=UPI0006C26163|nr:sulfite exporter TauE/SafE family protein [Achromobacter xylosoxidans]MCZ8437445.1 sulfite exporter TauE/SafE family protein [Achromobacter xylosoxidans]MDC6160920.1 sulfite exporter TauE/SafE family protein [Achromobacter xylosoxidans]WPQ36928.1 sulfite exporter TauE/SafE family protein [Achromobacter xylosoxidans]CUI27092.1 Sulfite exporter TauE/SafE [Achromobacter xylosoxidans]CUI65066.1 Sulfite exporter TauE/SafE [Achromobacter xylosoxidans]
MSLLLIALCLGAGCLIGFMGGVLGIGGGMIAIPALVLLMGMSQQLAQGTALIMVLPTIMMAVRKYNQQTRIDRRVALAGAGGAVVFTWVGARLALGIDSGVLRLSFAVFLFFIALFYAWQTWRAGRARRAPKAGGNAPVFTPRRAAALGVLCGTLGGFFGVGGAVLAVPIITTVFRLPQTTAQALALCMVIPGSAVALVTYSWAGQADWLVGLPLAAGSLLFVPVGVRLAYRLPERKLRASFAAMLFATVALLVFES